MARLFARKGMNEGPFPTHYEAFDNPLGYNPMYPKNPLVAINPAARILESTKGTAGDPADYPHVGTTYRLTEHFHYWTGTFTNNIVLRPEQFVEIGEALGQGAWASKPARRSRCRPSVVLSRLRQGDQAHRLCRSTARPSTTWAFRSTGLCLDRSQGLPGEQLDCVGR